MWLQIMSSHSTAISNAPARPLREDCRQAELTTVVLYPLRCPSKNPIYELEGILIIVGARVLE